MDATALPAMPTWAVVGIFVVGIIAILPLITAVLFMGSWVGRQGKALANQETETKVLRERVHDLANDLASHKQQIALEYVRQSALEKLEGTIMEAIKGLGSRIDQAILSRSRE